jgi:uncharacterized protein YdeI (YjbR/CyaY-like superfamily)
MNPKVDAYIARNERWEKEIEKLRSIALDCPLEEELKWGCPCYTYEGNNIILIHVFKEYAAFLFFKGALLGDGQGILIQQTRNVQAARQARFTNLKEITQQAKVLKVYIHEAIEVERAGLKVELKKTGDFPIPDEFKMKLNKSIALKKAFQALTPGRQRAYLVHFAQPKKAETRFSRVEKYIPHILKGKGLND